MLRKFLSMNRLYKSKGWGPSQRRILDPPTPPKPLQKCVKLKYTLYKQYRGVPIENQRVKGGGLLYGGCFVGDYYILFEFHTLLEGGWGPKSFFVTDPSRDLCLPVGLKATWSGLSTVYPKVHRDRPLNWWQCNTSIWVQCQLPRLALIVTPRNILLKESDQENGQ